jgi:poly(A) polymerase
MGSHAPHGDRHRSARSAALGAVETLAGAGHIAYFAGGCVRDELLGLTPTDYDVATDARPEQVAALFGRVQRVGESFGIMLVRLGGRTIQVATFRADGVYTDGRHPDSVTFTDAAHDAARRDFTINGLFEDPIEGRVIDYVGGRADLEARLVRAIGDPHARLKEDRLRMLRASGSGRRSGGCCATATALSRPGSCSTSASTSPCCTSRTTPWRRRGWAACRSGWPTRRRWPPG